jgi:hypothetical protein
MVNALHHRPFESHHSPVDMELPGVKLLTGQHQFHCYVRCQYPQIPRHFPPKDALREKFTRSHYSMNIPIEVKKIQKMHICLVSFISFDIFWFLYAIM